MTQKLPLALFLMGPTASGKTDLAIRLRQKYPVEIISVDSALIYRGMDIGTAKPDAQELALAPHRLIDILDPSEAYSAADFRRDALKRWRISSLRAKSHCWWEAQCSTLKPYSKGYHHYLPRIP